MIKSRIPYFPSFLSLLASANLSLSLAASSSSKFFATKSIWSLALSIVFKRGIFILIYMTIEEIKNKLTPVLEEYEIEYAGVFGSIARGDDRPESDVDLLVKFRKPVGLFKLMHFEDSVSNKLKKSRRNHRGGSK